MTKLKEITVNYIIGATGDEESGGISTKSLVLNFIRQNPEGVTSQMVGKHIGVSADRARDILNELCLRRDIYKRKLGDNNKLYLYYPNGKLIHKYLQNSKDMGDQVFRISFHEGKRGPRIQIQERKYTLLEGERVEGSVFIDYENVLPFMDFLNEMMTKFNNYKVTKPDN
jgi:hypothetical protein